MGLKWKKFIAYAKTTEGVASVRITSVTAVDGDAARDEIRRQLNRASRRPIFARWIEDGECVRSIDS